MNQEHQQGIRAFENCIQLFINLGRSQNEMYVELERIGLSKEDIAKIKTGEKYITEEQFYGLADILRGSMQLDKPLINWLDLADNWGLVGILEPTFSLKKNMNNEIINNLRAILDAKSQYVIINNPELHIDINDSLIHKYPNGHKEEFFIIDIDYSPYSRGRKPIYKLTVTRSKQNMQNTKNFNIGGNFQMDGNARFNTGNVTDNSSNTFNELPPDFFVQTRKTLESINSPYRQELYDILEKIENAKLSDDKKEGGQWLGKLLSSCFENSCVTLLQHALETLFNYFVR